MADTLTNLQDDVRDYLGNPPTSAISDAELTRKINQSYREVATRYRHPEVEKSETITTADGTATDALPSDYWYTQVIRNETDDFPLNYRKLSWIIAQETDSKGSPQFFTQHGTNLHFYPTPDGVYSLTHYYVQEITDLSSGGDLTVVNDAWDEAIVWGAVWRAFLFLQEYERMIHARNVWRTLVNSMPETEVLTAENSQQIIAPLGASPFPGRLTGVTE